MNFEFETTIENATVTLAFNYQPEEPMVRYYSDGTGYPGCPAACEDISAHWKIRQYNSLKGKWEDVELDVTELLIELGHDLEELCFEHINNY